MSNSIAKKSLDNIYSMEVLDTNHPIELKLLDFENSTLKIFKILSNIWACKISAKWKQKTGSNEPFYIHRKFPNLIVVSYIIRMSSGQIQKRTGKLESLKLMQYVRYIYSFHEDDSKNKTEQKQNKKVKYIPMVCSESTEPSPKSISLDLFSLVYFSLLQLLQLLYNLYLKKSYIFVHNIMKKF